MFDYINTYYKIEALRDKFFEISGISQIKNYKSSIFIIGLAKFNSLDIINSRSLITLLKEEMIKFYAWAAPYIQYGFNISGTGNFVSVFVNIKIGV